jgi:hypothetical protein
MSWRSQAIHTTFCENSKDAMTINPATNYRVETSVLVQAVKRNIERFPEDFLLQLSKEEVDFLRSQIVTLKKGRGNLVARIQSPISSLQSLVSSL